MNRITIWSSFFCAGSISAVFWPALPSIASVSVLFAISCILCVIIIADDWLIQSNSVLRARFCVAILGLCTGVIWLASVGHFYYAWQLPKGKIQQDVTISASVLSGGCVPSSPMSEHNDIINTGTFYYVVNVTKIANLPASRLLDSGSDFAKLAKMTGFRVRLTHRANILNASTKDKSLHCLHNGDSFSAVVKLKPAYGVANPVGFSLQQHLISKGIHATGYIKQLYAMEIHHHHSARLNIASQLKALELDNNAWWQALLIGIRQSLSGEDWQLLQITGTTHLFSISGMHLGVIAAFALLFACSVVYAGAAVRGLWLARVKRASLRFTPHTERNTVSNAIFSAPQRLFVLGMVLAFCWCYMQLSGMALPVVRAFVLVVISCAVVLFHVSLRPLHIGLAMLVISIFLFPLGILSASFYLSIGAVFAIWFFTIKLRLGVRPWYISAILLQCLLSILMIPLTLMWFGNASLVAIFANIIALPVVTLLLPLGLINLLLIMALPESSAAFLLAKRVFIYIDSAFGVLLDVLRYISQLPYAAFNVSIGSGAAVCLILACVLLFMPVWRYKTHSICMLLCCVVFKFIPQNDNQWTVHVLDAGQASAITITKGRRAIIIDSGAQFQGVALTASAYLLPLLNMMNVSGIDHVIHTHSDNDHAGGLRAVAASPLSKSAMFYSPVHGCSRGKSISWQHIEIAFLWPMKGNSEDSNAQSCVVKITDGVSSLLISGDIERASEYALLNMEKNDDYHNVKADLLIAPHHGSNTSSTNVFIETVNPNAVIYTQGFENRWKFPSHDVTTRYASHNVKQYLTSYHGYISATFDKVGDCAKKGVTWLYALAETCEPDFSLTTQRHHHAKRWYLRPYWPLHL